MDYELKQYSTELRTMVQAGFIGLGNMGSHMAMNLIRGGVDVTVFSRDPSKLQAYVDAGAKTAKTVAELAGGCDVVMCCLATVDACKDVIAGENGIISNAKPGCIVLDHSTVDIETTNLCQAAAEKKEVSFLDAPISGGPEGAKNATLAIMVGGTGAAFDTVKPLLEKMGGNVMRMGPTGAGTSTKLINQMLVSVHSAVACEAALVAQKANVDLTQLQSLLKTAWGGSRMLERNLPLINEEAFGESQAPIRNLVKDLQCVDALCTQHQLQLPMVKLSQQIYEKAVSNGLQEHDPVIPFTLLKDNKLN